MPHKEANTNNNAVNRPGNNLRDLGNDRVRLGQIMVTQFRDRGNEHKMLVTSIRYWKRIIPVDRYINWSEVIAVSQYGAGNMPGVSRRHCLGMDDGCIQTQKFANKMTILVSL